MGIIKARKIKHRLGMSITATVLTVIFAGFSYVGPIVALITAPTQSEIVANTQEKADDTTLAYSNATITEFINTWKLQDGKVTFTDTDLTATLDGALIAEITRNGSDLSDQELIDLGAEPAEGAPYDLTGDEAVASFITQWKDLAVHIVFNKNSVMAQLDGDTVAEITREGSTLTDQALIDLGAEGAVK
jgi:hypothetical protein